METITLTLQNIQYQLSLTNPRDANVMQTKVDVQCDKLATELN